jgi:tripartite-type tricarboxylate transporter receptor subunit TctC
MGHPIAMPPGTPMDRVNAMRKALDTMVKDPDFVADAKKRKLDLLPGNHEELERTVAEAFEATPAEIAIAKKYYRH